MSTTARALNPQDRAAALRRMETEEFDVLVIGAGIVGAGAALDAATRGLSVALVEARDYAAGTSSRSSKLIHGGLRYLEQLDFGLVREALRERSLILTTLAPHLARPIPFTYPLTHRVWERCYVGAGIALYDMLGGRKGVPAHRHLDRKQAYLAFPGLRDDALVGAIRYYDGQVDDARYTLAVARTAHEYGAVCAPSARVSALLHEGERITGARVTDLESGREIQVRARHTINATGVWSNDIQRLAGGQGSLTVRASKGVHLVVPRERIDASTGLITRTEKSVMFFIPWDRHWIIGTTDTDWNLDLAHPAATSADIDYLLEHANRLVSPPLTREDIVGVYAGLRPLLAGKADSTAKLSREHAVVSPAPGLTLIAGGKYTTYRVMAKDVVDAALKTTAGAAAREAAGPADETIPSSVTEAVPLIGASGYSAMWEGRAKLAQRHGLPVTQVERLLHRYGGLLHELLALAEDDPALLDPLEGAPPYLAVEAYYGASHEGALHLDDLLTRRTRISFETPDRGVAAAREVARIVAPVLGWNKATVDREVETYLARVAAERASQNQPTDQAADSVRREAPDIRLSASFNPDAGLPARRSALRWASRLRRRPHIVTPMGQATGASAP